MSERPQLSRQFLIIHKENRLIFAAAHEVAEKGYEAVTVTDIVRRAGVARNTFYEVFSSKATCFGAAVDRGFDLATGRIVEAILQADTLEGRVSAAVDEVLKFLRDEPSLASACIVDALAGAPEKREEGMERFACVTSLPEPIAHMIVGGVALMLYRRLVESQPTDELGPDLRKFVLAAFKTPV